MDCIYTVLFESVATQSTAQYCIHPFMHTFPHWRQSGPREVEASSSGAVRVWRLAQRHPDTLDRGSRYRTSNLLVTSQPALPALSHMPPKKIYNTGYTDADYRVFLTVVLWENDSTNSNCNSNTGFSNCHWVVSWSWLTPIGGTGPEIRTSAQPPGRNLLCSMDWKLECGHKIWESQLWMWLWNWGCFCPNCQML